MCADEMPLDTPVSITTFGFVARTITYSSAAPGKT
jgi:hypothetical protein